MSSVTFDFKFRAAPVAKGPLAFMTATLSVDGETFVTLNDWAVRDGQNGIWFAPPSREYTDKQGAKKYAKYFLVGASDETTKVANRWRQLFEVEGRKAFQAFQGGNGGGNSGGGGRGGPVSDAFAPVAGRRAPPPAAALPPGWTQGVDTKSGRPYYIDPTGKSQWESPMAGPPRTVAPPPDAAPSVSPPADPFSQTFGNDPFNDGPLPDRN